MCYILVLSPRILKLVANLAIYFLLEWQSMEPFPEMDVYTAASPGPSRKLIYFPLPTSQKSPLVPPQIPKSDVYTCSQCGKIYQYLHNLRKHQRMECGKEPQFACPHCPHRTYAKWNLHKHIRNRHQEIPTSN